MYGLSTRRHYEPIVCKDGFKMSVQAGDGLYSHPRCEASSYTEVEIGFPNKAESLLAEYAEDKLVCPTDTVYPYVPAKLVLEVIAKHGGMVGGELPPLWVIEEDEDEDEPATAEELFMHFVSEL